jgi:hypothetical protein
VREIKRKKQDGGKAKGKRHVVESSVPTCAPLMFGKPLPRGTRQRCSCNLTEPTHEWNPVYFVYVTPLLPLLPREYRIHLKVKGMIAIAAIVSVAIFRINPQSSGKKGFILT